MRKALLLTGLLAVTATTMVGLQDAEAKRLGGGKSFGSKPSYSSPYKRSATPSAPSQRQLAAQRQNDERRSQLASRGGMWGMLGGLPTVSVIHNSHRT